MDKNAVLLELSSISYRLYVTSYDSYFIIFKAFNILISVPEKCGSEFWFKIAEYLNFPQLSWPKDNFDKKKQQRHYLLPMLNDIEGAAESILNHGTTIAVVRHPFLRLYSGLSLHIQIKESFPNLDQ